MTPTTKPKRCVSAQLAITDDAGKQQNYRVTPVRNEDDTRALLLRKPDGTGYTVTLTTRGELTCNCPGYRFNRVCKHTAALAALLWLDPQRELDLTGRRLLLDAAEAAVQARHDQMSAEYRDAAKWRTEAARKRRYRQSKRQPRRPAEHPEFPTPVETVPAAA